MENLSNPHHLVLGELDDFLTGDRLPDTHDERYRQEIAKNIVITGQFKKQDIHANIPITIEAGKRKAILKVDFLVKFNGKTVVLIKYAPGSLVTRRLSTLALSRIVESYQIPFAIITNGEDAEIIDGASGKVILNGLENLPDKKNIEETIAFDDLEDGKSITFKGEAGSFNNKPYVKPKKFDFEDREISWDDDRRSIPREIA